MQTVMIEKGVRFKMNESVFEISREHLPGKFIIKNLTGNSEVLYDLKDLMLLHENGSLKFEPIGPATSLLESSGVRENKIVDYSMLPESERKTAAARYDAIKPLLPFAGQKMSRYFDAREKELELFGNKVSAMSLRRWFNAFVFSGGDITALVPNTAECGTGNRMSNEVEEKIDGILDSFYAKREKPSGKDAYAMLGDSIENINKFRTEETKIKMPSYNTVLRRIAARNPLELLEKREGKKYAFDKLSSVNTRVKPTIPLEEVEMDHTKLDLFVVDDDTRLPLGRPWITIAIDKATGNLIGLYVAFHSPSYVSVMKTMRHMMTSKYYVKELYPEIKNEWVAYGVPRLLVLDNGKEFRSRSLLDACKQLGINVKFCPPRKPWFKGQVERTFRTLNQQLIHQMPGTTFSNVVDKKDYDPKKNAIVGYKKLIYLIHRWVIDEYSQQYNKGVKGSPAKLWRDHIEKHGRPAFLDDSEKWDIVLGKLKTGSTIQRPGIQYQYLFYNSQALQELKLELMKKRINTVDFKYDPSDLSQIHVYNELNRTFITVPCSDQDYSQGLQEFTHKLLVRDINKRKKEVTWKELNSSKARLMAELKSESKRTSGARAAAHFQPSSAEIASSNAIDALKENVKMANLVRKHFNYNEEQTEWGAVNNANINA
ncbi:DDE-type integrase/transposase/recombinase [Paenibacillus chondroitinus]|uniref:DDE-type integrase/transposase/recombinase n=1 Tax=Paenibacillus chondroitinus TaxID=59842 RepID=A0ABU6DHG1_9BACL|nr:MULTISPECIES: DDE-type integrase/transposase/recombinase [Paenibacillus]MCY9658493.1 DDE-type integrase/transposase/recombinase [Paenibacillus anseongense]MEB4797205.1 DDE-type integrase/transposase/recombinase [Paenibacillus chondroitinus]